MDTINEYVEVLAANQWIAWMIVPAIGLLVGLAFYRILRRGINELGKRGTLGQAAKKTTIRIVRWVLFIVIALMILQLLGVELGSVWTIVSALLAMVAIGFVAVWSLLSNILSSLLIMFMKTINPGDEIEIIEPTGTTGLKGKVNDTNLLYTTLTSTDEEGQTYSTTVPNNLFYQKCIRRLQP